MNFEFKIGKHKPNFKGFTLIELIVVIAIVSILASMAVPNLFSLIDRSKVAADMQNVAVLNSVTNVYAIAKNSGKSDIFDGFDNDRDRINELIDVGFLAVVPEPVQNDVEYKWNIDNQKWDILESGNGDEIGDPDETPPAEPTIVPPNNYPLWESGKAYTFGDFVSYNDRVFWVRHWSQNQEPGLISSPWQEVTHEWRNFNVYYGGDTVNFNEKRFTARYETKNQQPGNINSPWQELTDEWRNFNEYVTGDTVTYNGNQFTARNWSKNHQPGLINSPWQQQTDIWTSFNVYNTNDEVWHNNKRYQAKWYSQNANPQSSNAWRLIG